MKGGDGREREMKEGKEGRKLRIYDALVICMEAESSDTKGGEED